MILRHINRATREVITREKNRGGWKKDQAEKTNKDSELEGEKMFTRTGGRHSLIF